MVSTKFRKPFVECHGKHVSIMGVRYQGGTTCIVDDLFEEDRWKRFTPPARELGLRSVLAYPLSTGRPSALNLYSMLPRAFSPVDRAQGHLFSTLARLSLDSAYQRAAGDTRAENLTEALRTRELIGQAQGILMERERLTADQAFGVLRTASQRMNVKLRSVAEDLVRTGEHPSATPDS
jgi:ANTAR domain